MRMCLAHNGISAEGTIGHRQVPCGVRPSGMAQVDKLPGFFGLLTRVTSELRCDNLGELVGRRTP